MPFSKQEWSGSEGALRTQKSADIAGGCFLSLLGLVTLLAATEIKGELEERLPPRTLPYILGATVLIAGVALAFKAWRSTFEGPAIRWPNRAGAKRILVVLVSLALYIALMNPLGMPISTALYVAFSVWYLRRGRHRVLVAVITGVISGVVVLYLFIHFLELSFPVGPLQR